VIPYSFDPEAETELIEASAFFESRLPGLGKAFAASVQSVITLIREYPEIGTPDGPSRRRVLVRRFPYAVVYEHRQDSIFVLAVAHTHRRPGYWQDRE